MSPRPRRICEATTDREPDTLPSMYAIGGRRGEADGCAKFRECRKKIVRRSSLQQDSSRTDAQRKQHEATQPEGEGNRWRADEPIVAVGAQHVFAEGVANRQHVAVEMHGALGHPGRARRERDQAYVVACGIACLEIAHNPAPPSKFRGCRRRRCPNKRRAQAQARAAASFPFRRQAARRTARAGFRLW